MNREELFQGATYASAEAHRLSFTDRLIKRADQPVITRLGKAAAGNFFKHLIDIPKEIIEDSNRYELINSGLANLIYASTEQVIRINIRTLSTDQEKVIKEVQKSRAAFELCNEYMGEHWLGTHYAVRQFLGRSALEARQSRLYPIAIFRSVEELLKYGDDEAYVDQLGSLFSAIANLYQHTGFYPDILGANNIALVQDGLDRSKLVILDTDPASPTTQQQRVPNQSIIIGDAIKEKLTAWANFLDTARVRFESREIVLR